MTIKCVKPSYQNLRLVSIPEKPEVIRMAKLPFVPHITQIKNRIRIKEELTKDIDILNTDAN